MLCTRSTHGYSLLELLLVLGIVVTLTGIAIPQILATLDDYRVSGAARYVATRIQRTRMEAVSRSTAAAMQFVQTGGSYSFGVYSDGNGDGVRTQDIRDGIDPQMAAIERLPDTFSGVEFGLLPGLPPVDVGGAAPGEDPIKLGASNLLSYSPVGTSTSGSVYVRGRGQSQCVVRVFGDTGRTRVLKFDVRTRQWRPI
jgi:type II secretory pathway pseudopilin PulG